VLRLSSLLKDLVTARIDSDIEIETLTTDSREVAPGALFAAIPGAKIDGRKFIADAVAKGAVAVLAPVGTQADVPVIETEEPRRALALLAARFYGAQPKTIAAVTGTNGKTSVAQFTRQIWAALGHPSAALGTLGLIATGFPNEGSLTTPDPVTLHQTIARLKKGGIEHLALEASSHGLYQSRLDGLEISAAGFTNLSRDHLDYHGDMASYFAAKALLFSRVLPEGGTAVINADAPEAEALIAIATSRRQRIIRFGQTGDIAILDRVPGETGQDLTLSLFGATRHVRLPLAGSFQASNALCALGLAIGGGSNPVKALETLAKLEGASGRLQRVASAPSGAPIYVDYAHTPDALETVLVALRPHAKGKLVVVFGCGGDRDPGKRPIMGEIASRLADRAIVTDDNPRTEDAALIRKAVMAGTGPGDVTEIGDREAAIAHAIAGLKADDLLVIAGKGHEQGQIVGKTVIPFDDAEVARRHAGGQA
jgi:UDP-N-acetylmuramoyl-L-alanyl-D-glutamate--2,6-diaminopimelate ligase